mmetsp:Transcript_11647/g.34249  ORF Transcript_11647/g.34249 Transcript_11647/m.34249 type:complete len:729 (-) Transcript_11647:105-2291(-)|eukprot:CAMPEP_0113558460 /NCGR_PEP_ID=MMETSP0015_2-20120614/18360_1 /TAXON_ID=2838 /ORGANISM="Odontella" /LENGTH=728 /DNA_ID=CAMNT_0000460001 /DNA_START=454 /DNA_END=2640 /DNA_ORIENTATION=+ /assembly_acc=CAM_ASM_000160
MARPKVDTLTRVGAILALVIFLDTCSDNASVAGLQLSRRIRASRRAGRKPGTALFPRPRSRSLDTQRKYRIDESEIDRHGRSLTVPLGNTRGEAKVNNYLDVPNFPTRTANRKKVVVTSLDELRAAVLDDGIPLRKIELVLPEAPCKAESSFQAATKQDDHIFNHEVLKIISERAKTKSKPGKRAACDKAKLALSIEGGGMRGAVSAGMVSAIACLGLSDCFDTIYGSSAGSIVGAYMVSGQMCIDVYTDVLPAAKKGFISTKRMMSTLVQAYLDTAVSRASFGGVKPKASCDSAPGLNISFVLDGIMCPEFGLRPLDLESFRANDARQPLRVVSSAVRDGKMDVVCFGSKEKDFFDDLSSDETENFASTSIDGTKPGLFACLKASMKVPAATGSPVSLMRSEDISANITSQCFDAFCYEPIPYRSAVEEGATHVLVLRTRPEGVKLRTKPTVYENLLAPNYFKSHHLPQVAEFFKKGGQQYIYLEDILTLAEALKSGKKSGVPTPPPDLFYGTKSGDTRGRYSKDRNTWKKAHLLPITPPEGTRELSTLSQNKDNVLQAIREGFAVAFDTLAPSAGLDDLSKYPHLNGKRVAELIFPGVDSPISGDPSEGKGNIIDDIDSTQSRRNDGKRRRLFRGGIKIRSFRRNRQRGDEGGAGTSNYGQVDNLPASDLSEDEMFWEDLLSIDRATRQKGACPKRDAKRLLTSLPGIKEGNMSELADGLHYHSGR